MPWEPRPKAFHLEAQQYYDAGFVPLPLVPGPALPATCHWAKFAEGMPLNVFQWILNERRLGESELGLVLGTRHGEHRFVAVVVRDLDLIADVTAALETTPCAVRAPDRLTIFVRAPFDPRLRRFQCRQPHGRWERTRVTVEGRGRYVVVPPTRLWSRPQWFWVGRPLLEVGIDQLPLVTAAVLDEIQAIVDGPGEPFKTLTTLTADGAEEACRAVVQALFARRWPDEAIISRIGRALQVAQVWAGDTVDLLKISTLVPAWLEEERRKVALPPSARVVTVRWLGARATLPSTRDERRCWWTRSALAYADCQEWTEREGYAAPSEVAWGTTLTRLGIKSAVKKVGGRSLRTRNLRIKPQP